MILIRFVFLKVFVGIYNGDFFNLKHFYDALNYVGWGFGFGCFLKIICPGSPTVTMCADCSHRMRTLKQGTRDLFHNFVSSKCDRT